MKNNDTAHSQLASFASSDEADYRAFIALVDTQIRVLEGKIARLNLVKDSTPTSMKSAFYDAVYRFNELP